MTITITRYWMVMLKVTKWDVSVIHFQNHVMHHVSWCETNTWRVNWSTLQIQPDETSKIGVFVKVGNKWPLVGCEYRESAHNLDWRVMNFLLSRWDVMWKMEQRDWFSWGTLSWNWILNIPLSWASLLFTRPVLHFNNRVQLRHSLLVSFGWWQKIARKNASREN